MNKKFSIKKVSIPDSVVKEWQDIVDILAELLDVPAALIMRASSSFVEVFRASQTEGNPYSVGDRQNISGVYCEEVIKNKKELLVKNATTADKWKDNPDIELDMISYLGYPLCWPDGDVFGTLCVLDKTERGFSEKHQKVMNRFKGMIEQNLALIQKESHLKGDKNRYRAIFENTGTATLIVEENNIISRVNRQFEALSGYKKEEVEGKKAWTVFFTDDVLEKMKRYHRLRRENPGEAPNQYESKFVDKNGEVKEVLITIGMIPDSSESVASLLDISKEKETQERLEALQNASGQMQELETQDDLCKYYVDFAREVLDFDFCALEMFGEHKEVSQSLYYESPEEGLKDNDLRRKAARKSLEKEGPVRARDVEEGKKDDWPFPGFISVSVGSLGSMQIGSKQENPFKNRDIDLLELFAEHLLQQMRRIKLQRKLYDQAIRDPLTGLYNRRHFNQTLKKEIERSRRSGHTLTFVMIDINGFKAINDMYSHSIGDEVLCAVADMLKRNVRDMDTIVRYGGDEFLVMMPETDGSEGSLESRLEKDLYELNEQEDCFDFCIDLAIGQSSWSPEHEGSAEEAVKEADRKMYVDKERRRDNLSF